MILKRKLYKRVKRQGRNNQGKITVRHRGAGSNKRIRILKNSRSLFNIVGIVNSHEYDPNRNVYISAIFYETGDKEYIIKPKGLNIGDTILYVDSTNYKLGYSTLLKNINPGTKIYNIEFYPKSKTFAVRTGDSSAILLSKNEKHAMILLPSKEIRLFDLNCIAYIGTPEIYKNIKKIKNKAGRSRHLGIRPTVRGSAMNPVDHPHGGGEGKSPIGRKSPLTPWGKKTLGLKTRKNKNNILILKKRNN